MSAEIIPLPSPPQAVADPLPPNVTPLPLPLQEDALSKLLKNPLVLAGGAVLAGMALTRLLSAPPVRRLARDLADEALRRARASSGPAAAEPSLLEQGLEAVRPQVTDIARGFLDRVLKKF